MPNQTQPDTTGERGDAIQSSSERKAGSLNCNMLLEFSPYNHLATQ